MDQNEVSLEQIEHLRIELMKLANEKGFTHRETINVSQTLDYLLNDYQKTKSEELLKES